MYVRTDGNPLFLSELVKSLVEQRALLRDGEGTRWRWQKSVLRSIPVAADVATILSKRVRGLPHDACEALRLGACLGISFELSELCAVAHLAPEVAWQHLELSVRAGLLLMPEEAPFIGATPRLTPASIGEQTYEFVHDRVLGACLGLMSETEHAHTALQIGRTLRDTAQTRDASERPLRLAGFFNAAKQLLHDPAERTAAATLNLAAGQEAKRRGAFSQALAYFQSGLGFLEDSSGDRAQAWIAQRDLARALHEEAAECALLDGRVELVHELCDVLLTELRAPTERVLAYDVRISALKTAKKFSAAVDVALESLNELGVRFPRRPGEIHAALGYLSTKRAVFSGPVSRLYLLPDMKDAGTKAVSRVIQSVYSAAYLGRPDLFPLLVYRHVNDSLKHGNEGYSAATYIAFSIVLAGLGAFEQAQRLGEVALELLNRFEAERLRGASMMGFYTFVFPWRNAARDSLPHLDEALAAGLRVGDFEYSCYLMTIHSMVRLHSGGPLSELAIEFERHRSSIAAYRQERSILLQNIFCQVIHDLKYHERGTSLLAGPIYDEVTGLPQCLEPRDENLMFHNHLCKLMVATFLGDSAAARDAARLGRPRMKAGAFANFLQANFLFYEALSTVAVPPGAKLGFAAMRAVTRTAKRLKAWAEHAPANFLSKFHLLEAETHRLRRAHARAAKHYEKSIELASQYGCVHELAFAQERAALYYFERGMLRLGRQYLSDSHASYARWGAAAVLRRLERDHAQHFALMASRTEQAHDARRFSEGLDYLMLLKSSQAISGEVLLPRLLEQLLKTTLEHAAAQRGLLLLERSGQLYVAAEADVEEGSRALAEPEPLEDTARLCQGIVRYVARTEKPVLLVDAAREGMFVGDDYVVTKKPKSVLCTPILYQGRLLGIAYLENNHVSHVFTEARLEVVNLLAGQAAISMAIARFHSLQLEAHQAKIKPHFLFNALSSIADLALTDGQRAEEALLKLAQLYRYILTTTAEDLVSLEQELEVVASYLALEQLRFGTKLVYSVDCRGDMSGVKLPGMLIQPLVENSVRHGIAHRTTPGHVRISASIIGERCCILVQDDGPGDKSTPSLSSGTGFGLRSVQERLVLAYDQDYSFAITSTAGYRVEIELPATSTVLTARLRGKTTALQHSAGTQP
jgi:predicted ATPase/GAF domain-containing protein